MTRDEQVVLLLRSRHAWHPTLKSQFSTFGAVPGEKATVWRQCGACDGLGTLRTRKGDESCSKCGGDGRFLVDAYTGRRDGETDPTRLFSGAQRGEWRRKTDAQIARMQQQTEPPRSEADLIADAQPYLWERERDRHYRAGDYRALDLALEWLHSENPQARALVGWVYESGAFELGCLHSTVVTAAELGVRLLAGRMPDPIRVPQWLIRPTEKQAEQIRRRTVRSQAA